MATLIFSGSHPADDMQESSSVVSDRSAVDLSPVQGSEQRHAIPTAQHLVRHGTQRKLRGQREQHFTSGKVLSVSSIKYYHTD